MTELERVKDFFKEGKLYLVNRRFEPRWFVRVREITDYEHDALGSHILHLVQFVGTYSFEGRELTKPFQYSYDDILGGMLLVEEG